MTRSRPAHLKARLASGAEKLDLTKAWISQAVEGFLASAGDEGERSRRAAGLRDGREVSRNKRIYTISSILVTAL